MRYRPLEADIKEAEVYRLGFCRFSRRVDSFFLIGHFQKTFSLSKVNKNVRSGFGFSGPRLSRSLPGRDTVVNRRRHGLTVELHVAKKTNQTLI